MYGLKEDLLVRGEKFLQDTVLKIGIESFYKFKAFTQIWLVQGIAWQLS